MKLTLGFSPCPNDTFIFDALVNKRIDTQGLEFDVVMEDVQTLNQWAQEGKLDISKISYGVLPLILDEYVLLDSGGALGRGVGPLLVAKHSFNAAEINSATIAIPGENTTAHFLFSLAYPEVKKKVFTKFSKIEEAVLRDEVDAGVIIHENRFTYEQKGLVKLTDLGDYWEKENNIPIPLGGIVAKRNLPKGIAEKMNDLIVQSVSHAFTQYPVLSSYVRENAQEMDEDVMRSHIALYVNEYSRQLGDDGKKAVLKLLNVYEQLHPGIKINTDKIFIE